jgi:hypothetical protein
MASYSKIRVGIALIECAPAFDPNILNKLVSGCWVRIRNANISTSTSNALLLRIMPDSLVSILSPKYRYFTTYSL